MWLRQSDICLWQYLWCGRNMKYVIQLVEPKPEPEVPRVGTERPRRRTTRLSDVRIR